MKKERPHRKGNVRIGRMMVLAAGLLALGVDWFVYKQASANASAMTGLPMGVAISVLWMLAGLGGLLMRKLWGLYLLLTILFGGSGVFFVIGVMLLAEGNGTVAQLRPLGIAIVVYFIVGLVLTKSRNVGRLTSRTWE